MTVIGLFGYWAAAGALCNESASRLPAIRRHTSAMVFLPPTRRRDDGRRAPFAQVAGGGRPDGRAAVHPRYLSRGLPHRRRTDSSAVSLAPIRRSPASFAVRRRRDRAAAGGITHWLHFEYIY